MIVPAIIRNQAEDDALEYNAGCQSELGDEWTNGVPILRYPHTELYQKEYEHHFWNVLRWLRRERVVY